MSCHNILLKTFFAAVLAGTVSACFDWGSSSNNGFYNFELTMQDLEHQLKNKYEGKMIPAKLRNDRLIHTFIERNAMAEAIQSMNDFKQDEMDAELKRMRNELIINRYLKSMEKVDATDEQVKAYFEDNKSEFIKRKVRVGQIFLRTSENMKADQKKAIKEKAQKIIDQLAAGDDFAKLAEQHSDDRSTAKRGGDIGWISSNQSRHTLLEAAMELKESGVSPLIDTKRGFYILKALEGPIDEEVTFESVKGKIAYDLKYQNKVKAMGELKNKAASRIARDYKRFQIQR